MFNRLTNQEWKILIDQSESSSLSKLQFCKLNGPSPSTCYAKRHQLKEPVTSQGFIQAEMVEDATKYRVSQTRTTNMTLFVNDIELSILRGTPATYVAELIGALS